MVENNPNTKPEVQVAYTQQDPDRFWKITTVVLIVFLAFFAFRNNTGSGVAPTGQVVGALPNPGAPAAPTVDMKKLVDDDPFLGSKDALVTIVEFSDFQCPFCARFHTQTWPELKSKYIDTGKVKFVYRDFPLSFHPNAQPAAEAAECAGKQGKYWEMHEKLFSEGVDGGVNQFKQYGQQLGLDSARFNRCLDSGETKAEVQKDFNDGGAAGVQGTPAFFVNGKEISGAQPFSVFEQVIEAELQ